MYRAQKGQIFAIPPRLQELSAGAFWWQNPTDKMGKQMQNRKWIAKALAEGFGLGPFAYLRRIETRLRKEVPLAAFSQQISGQWVQVEPAKAKPALPRRVIRWLYECSLQARKQREIMDLARRTLRTMLRQKSKNKAAELLKLLKEYPKFDPERVWREALGSETTSRTQRSAAQLEYDILELNYQIHKWKGFADWGTWQEHYRINVVMMDEHLAKRRRTIFKTKTERATVIGAALEAIGLKTTESTEAILRMLRRDARASSQRKSSRKT
ncbi:MAG: hypothetical protein WA755_16670 [Candidatus Acidiferrales bacterium]